MSSRQAPCTRRAGTGPILLVLLPCILLANNVFGNELRVLPSSERPEGEVRLLRDHLRPLTHAALDRILRAYEALNSPW